MRGHNLSFYDTRNVSSLMNLVQFTSDGDIVISFNINGLLIIGKCLIGGHDLTVSVGFFKMPLWASYLSFNPLLLNAAKF